MFLGLAGISHAVRGSHGGREKLAMISDLAAAAVLGVFLLGTALAAQ